MKYFRLLLLLCHTILFLNNSPIITEQTQYDLFHYKNTMKRSMPLQFRVFSHKLCCNKGIPLAFVWNSKNTAVIFHIKQLSKMKKVSPIDSQSPAVSIVSILQIRTSPSNQNTSDSGKICKICLEEEITDFNQQLQMNHQQAFGMQLMVPCECSGSVGFVHEKCIRTWLQIQICKNGKKQAFCQICGSQIHFKMQKIKYCDFTFGNLAFISSCNIISAIVQTFLLVVTATTFSQSDSILLKQVLIILICVLSLALWLTLFLIFKQAFIKAKRAIVHIFSIQESEQLGLRQIRRKKQNSSPKTSYKLPDRHFIMKAGKVNQIANRHQQLSHRNTQNPLFIELNRLPLSCNI